VSGAGTLVFTATANGTSAGTGTAITGLATTSPATTIQEAAGLAVTFAAQPAASYVAGQVVALTASVQNTAAAGGAVANGVTVTPTVTTVSGTATATCGAVTPGATAIAAGATQAYAFSCTVSGAGTLAFTATANGTSAGTGTAISGLATTSPATTIQTAADVTAGALVSAPDPAPAAGTFSIVLTVNNAGQADATVTGASLTSAPIHCDAPTLPTVGGGSSQAVIWANCSAPNANSYGIAATATWRDVNNPANAATTAIAVGTVVIQ